MSDVGRERGAALVEYVLLVAFVALIASAAIEMIGNAADQRYDRTAGGVSGGSWSSPGGSPDGDEDPAEGGGGGGPPPVPTTNPAAPTTTTTTTAPPSATASAVEFDSSSWSAGWFQWAGSATFAIVDAAGRPIVGASVEITITTSGGSTSTLTASTDANGRVVVPVGPYGWYGSWGGTSHVDVAVTGVEVPGSTWDASAPTTRVTVP